jgi:hypothetical protein
MMKHRTRFSRWKRESARLNAKAGKRVWTRQLVLREKHADGSVTKRVFFAKYPLPAFRCTFVSEDGDKHLNVIGPDGKEYTAHKCYAGQNPAVTVSFDGFYKPSLPTVYQGDPCPECRGNLVKDGVRDWCSLCWGTGYADIDKLATLPAICMVHVPGFSTPRDENEDVSQRYTYLPPT